MKMSPAQRRKEEYIMTYSESRPDFENGYKLGKKHGRAEQKAKMLKPRPLKLVARPKKKR